MGVPIDSDIEVKAAEAVRIVTDREAVVEDPSTAAEGLAAIAANEKKDKKDEVPARAD